MLLAVLLLAGCATARLDGPDYPVAGPPYIAPGQAAVEPLDVAYRMILIGDAGLYLENDPTLTKLGAWSSSVGDASVVFLGDNIYDDGLIEAEREKAERILSQQLAATTVRKIFIPGNHDWGMDPADQNIAAIRNQQAFIDSWPEGNAQYGPRDGCLGPEAVTLYDPGGVAPALVLVMLDPTPFLTPRLRDFCPEDQPDDAHFAQLDALLADHANDHVVVASHYPMRTGGPHGGMSYGFFADIVVGIYGWLMGSLGNTYEPEYAAWIARTEAVFRRNPPLVYAAGHDHSLQVLASEGEVGVHVVSGAGAPKRVSTVTAIPSTLFAHAAPGFVVLDLGNRSGERAVVLRVVENGFADPVFELELTEP